MKNKKLMWNILLLLLPLLAVGLAAMPDSVTVLTEQQIQRCSFFGTLPDGSRPMGLAFCALLIFVLFGVLAVYAVTNKNFLLNAACWLSLGAATLSVLPRLRSQQQRVIPNVAVTVILCVEAGLAAFRRKQGEKPQAKRLK